MYKRQSHRSAGSGSTGAPGRGTDRGPDRDVYKRQVAGSMEKSKNKEETKMSEVLNVEEIFGSKAVSYTHLTGRTDWERRS